MKPIKLTLSVLLLIFSTSSLVHAQETIKEREAKAKKLQRFYNYAQRSYQKGDVEEAQKILQTILNENPNHGNANALMQKIKLVGGKKKLVKKRREFDAIIIDKIDLSDATLSQAIKTLNRKIIDKTKNKFIPNFVIQDPKKVLGAEKITLELTHIPAGVILDNIMKMSGCTAKFDKHTIIIRPNNTAKRPKKLKIQEMKIK